jgi:hypothetical protein
MTFRASQPMDLEWFGGLDSLTPPNDLPPFSAVRADNCVYPRSGVGSRSGFSGITNANPGSGANSPANSLVVVTTRNGAVADRQLFIGFENGEVSKTALDPTLGGLSAVPMSPLAATPNILTATQYYQRAVLCMSGADGYGRFASVAGASSLGALRFSPPIAPILSLTVIGSGCTPGSHRFALIFQFTDGSESPMGAAGSIVTTGTEQVNISWAGAAQYVGPDVAFIYLCVTTAGDPNTFRRLSKTNPYSAMSFAFKDDVLQTYPLMGNQTRYRSPKFPALGVEYSGRVAYFGEKHRAVAGWDTGGSQGTDLFFEPGVFRTYVPGGWTVVSGLGCGISGVWGAIQFDGATAVRAKLKNVGTVVNDLPGIAQLQASGWSGTFGIRIAYSKSSGLTSGSLKFGLTGTTGSTSQTINLGPLLADTVYVTEFTASGSFSNDISLFYEGIGPGISSEIVSIVFLECFDPTNTSHRSTVWWSEPTMLRTIDTLTGGQTFGAADGETAWLGFEWQGRFMVAKDTSLWVTQRSSSTPNEWPIEKLSDLMGVCGRRAIGHGPDFKILVNRGGCWLFQGSAVGPDGNIANEIPVEWTAINWAQAWQIWVAVDDIEQRITIGVPTGASTYCNSMYVLDYSGGFGPAGEAGGRRWSVWPIEARGGVVARRGEAGQSELWIARYAAVTSIVGYHDPAATLDWNADDIPMTYETGKIGASDGALGLYRRVALAAEGDGILSVALVKAENTVVSLPAPTLYTPMRGTQHLLCNVTDERVGVRIATAGSGAKVLLHRLSVWIRRNPFRTYRPRTP